MQGAGCRVQSAVQGAGCGVRPPRRALRRPASHSAPRVICTAPHSAPSTRHRTCTLHPALGTRQALHGVRPPAPAHRVLAARRRLPHRGAAGPGAEARPEVRGGHRAREHVLVGGRSTTPPASVASTRFWAARCTSRRAAGSTRAARAGETANHLVLLAENEHRLQEPHQAGLGRLHRGLLLQAAHRQGAAGRGTRRG